MLSESALAEQTYQRHLGQLQVWVGWFALIRGDRLGGVFPTHEAATAAWMSLYGPVPALIRRIEQLAPPASAVAAPLTVSCSWARAADSGKAKQDYAA